MEKIATEEQPKDLVKKSKVKKTKVKKARKEKLTKKMRKNPYIVLTFALGLLSIILIVGSIIENNTINKTENEILCSVIYETPAWVNADGKIVQYGMITPQNASFDLVNQFLIPERIKLLYNFNNPNSETQINYFKTQGTFNAYLNKGLVVNCQEVLK